MGISQKTPHSWCSGRLVLASPVSTMVEPLLLAHALAGAQKTESSTLLLLLFQKVEFDRPGERSPE